MLQILKLNTALGALFLAGCAQQALNPPPERYRCESGVEMSARFSENAVAIDSTRGYETLFRDAAPMPSPPNPNSYRNPRMNAEFKLGKDGREAVLRYPLVPLVLRCVKDL